MRWMVLAVASCLLRAASVECDRSIRTWTVGFGDVRAPDACPAFPHPVRRFAASAEPMAMPRVVVVMEGMFLIAFGSFGHPLLEAKVRGYLKVSRGR